MVNRTFYNATGAISEVKSIAVSASRDLATTDAGAILDVTTPAAVVLTIQTFATVAIPVNTILNVARLDATNTFTVTAVAGVTINGTDAGSITMVGAYTEISLRHISTNNWMIIGDVT